MSLLSWAALPSAPDMASLQKDPEGVGWKKREKWGGGFPSEQGLSPVKGGSALKGKKEQMKDQILLFL